MKICLISKYPPIEGGVAAKSYWLAKALGARGHQVHVVTNADEVEDSYREEIPEEERGLLEPQNVRRWSTSPSMRKRFIPQYNPHIAKLANLALAVVREVDVDLVYSHYLLPYGVAALLVKQLGKLPLIVRHAGSDITSLYRAPFLHEILREVLAGADVVLGTQRTKAILKGSGINPEKVAVIKQAVNLREFHPDNPAYDFRPYGIPHTAEYPVITYIGKVSALKNPTALLRAAARLKDLQFSLAFVVGRGTTIEQLKGLAKELGIDQKCVFLPFVPPWSMSRIMTASTCIVKPESDEEPYLPRGTHYPIVSLEAMACACCTIIGEKVKGKGIYRFFQDGVHTLAVNPSNPESFAEKLAFIIQYPQLAKKIGAAARALLEQHDEWDDAIQIIESVFLRCVETHHG
ncbi:MAG: glycosyltransferase family 4 protein [Candidatus Tectomicrobia bacterium]|nr:glycosyltransferase family 4 protein [Candidatus Tectomicrobia bacterium]